MKRLQCTLFLLLLLAAFGGMQAAERTCNVLFIQSYTPQSPWCDKMNEGISKGFAESGMKANIVTEYLDANYWTFRSEKVIMKRFCQRARERGIDIIVTASDEAFYTLFSCGDSLPYQLPVVFFGIKYPDLALINSLPNVCGYTSNPDFNVMLKRASQIFPQRKEVVCVIDNSFLSNKGKEDFLKEWNLFSFEHPDYSMTMHNTQEEATDHIIAAICYPRNATGRIVIAPKWSPFLSFVGKNSKAPFFSCQNLALMNGVFCARDSDPYASSHLAGVRAAQVVGGALPVELGVTSTRQDFYYDYKQLEYFRVNANKVAPDGIVVNEPYWDKYNWLFILLYLFILVLLIFVVGWLIRINRREARRRIHVQTRLLVQNRLVAQRDEFDNVFHSIRDGVVTYDTDLNIHFTNRSLLNMLHLPIGDDARPYEGSPAGAIFHIYHEGKDILHDILRKVATTGKSVNIPENSFMKEVHSEYYFPVSGEVVPIFSKQRMTGMALSARNISDEELQRRFFTLAIEESSIYPWQYHLDTDCFTFPHGFLKRFGYEETVTSITHTEMDEMVYSEDLEPIRTKFSKALAGDAGSTRMSFRQRNAKGEYEWMEYRTSILKGMSMDTPYNILGVCQSIQQYKNTEQELTDARDKALQADKLKSAFLANMSHEIRTPLNVIVGFSDLFSDTSDFTPEEVAQFIGTINKNCGLLLALINDILDLSRIESGTMDFRFTRHNLPLLLKTVCDSQQLNMPEGVELVLRMPEDDKKYLVTDNVRLQQVVNNLINNAAKFTTNGSITFGYEVNEQGYTNLFVEDTGVGISEEGVKHIFERFFKVDNFTQGAGLGLSICQTIVERLKGTITVTSEVGKGTRFTVRIPDACE